jgi:uncharacterized membrane protein YqjE
MPPEAGAPRPPGLLDSIARLARTALALARTRLEILATELEEERIRLAQLVLLVAGIAFCVQVAVILLVLLVVVLTWDTHRLATLGVLTGLFFLAALAGALWVRHLLHTRPKLFASTIAELAKDEDRLEGGGR